MSPPSARGRRRSFVSAGVLALALTACAAPPLDPDGSLDRITESGLLRAGASPSGELVIIDDPGPSGALVDLVDGFAEQYGARVSWHVDSEEDLVQGLADGRLDVVVGGMTTSSPWTDLASVTRGYPAIAGSEGADVAFLLPLGENGLQAALETYLDEETR
ncbi:hypothetical protein [Microbacterium luteum]|uniref:hypothetical protein n=1 Tax=Microbacterium TaxID=33882 RepID=UPI001E50554B|nr:hypothetical protein [Microbacterium luteum]